MPRIRSVEQALRLSTDISRQTYVCRSCRANTTRQFHTSLPLAASQEPFLTRMRNSLFGSKESKEAEKRREERTKQKIEELRGRGRERGHEQEDIEEVTGKGGRVLEVAPFVDPAINKDYVVATTWDELENVGSEKWVKAKNDRGEQYVGFFPSKRTKLTDEQWRKLLHHITVEVLALQKAGRDLSAISLPRGGSPDNWSRTRNTTIAVNEADGTATLSFQSQQDETAISETIPYASPEKQESSDSPLLDEVSGAVAEGSLSQYPDDSIWMNMRLGDPTVKLAIVKRTMQLTGSRISDPIISKAKTLVDLYNAFKTPEKPKRLAQTPQLQQLKVEAPNVSVRAKRHSWIHKEKEIGRWKIIEDELQARDLPIKGSKWKNAKIMS